MAYKRCNVYPFLGTIPFVNEFLSLVEERVEDARNTRDTKRVTVYYDNHLAKDRGRRAVAVPVVDVSASVMAVCHAPGHTLLSK